MHCAMPRIKIAPSLPHRKIDVAFSRDLPDACSNHLQPPSVDSCLIAVAVAWLDRRDRVARHALVLSTSPVNGQSPGRFVPVDSPSKASLRGLSVVDARVAWASGAEGTVLRTVDGGKTIELLSVPGGQDFDFRDLHAFDEKTCSLMVAGQPARFYHTADGGQTWSLAYEDKDERAFFDADGVLGRTSRDRFWRCDRRATGHRHHTRRRTDVASESAPAMPGGGRDRAWLRGQRHLPDDGLGRSGLDRTGWPAEHRRRTRRARVVFSADGGKSWSSASTTLAGSPSAGIFSLLIEPAGNGLAVGGDYQLPAEAQSVISLTRDGGKTWSTPAKHGLRGFRSCVAKATVGGARVLIACGPEGCDYSLNDGSTWQPIDGAGYHVVDFAPDGVSGWAAGSDGRLARWVAAQK